MKNLKECVTAAKNVLVQMKRNRAMRMFQRMMADKNSGLDQIVGRAAERRAWAMVMNWLDAKRIRHCRFCPNTEQLRRHADYYVCVPHWEMVKSEPSTNGKDVEKSKISA